MNEEAWLSNLKALANAIDEKFRSHFNMGLVETMGVDEEAFQSIKELMPMAEEFLTEEDMAYGKLNYLHIERIRQANLSDDDKIIMGAIYGVAALLNKEKNFLRSFEPYSKNHPAFKNTNLSRKQRKNELISLEGCKIINDYIFLDGHYFRLLYYTESMVKYLKETKDKYKTFARIDPYVILEEKPPKELLEAIIRPIDPKWIQKLTIYPGNMTAGEYVLQNPLECRTTSDKLTPEEQLKSWE